MPWDGSGQRASGDDIEALDENGELCCTPVLGRVEGADSVTLTINELHTSRNSPHGFRLALVTAAGDQAADPL